MKNKNYLKVTTMFAIALFFVCAAPKANAQASGAAASEAKKLAKKALTEGKVEIIDCKMEKTIDKDGVGTIKVTGTAIYTPAKFKKKSFDDITCGYWSATANFYDAKGMKLKCHLDIGDYGENNQIENVKYKKPFPFYGETTSDYIGKENFEKADYCVIKGYNTIEQASSKDSKASSKDSKASSKDSKE